MFSRDRLTLPCLGGPACGEERPFHPSGWLVILLPHDAHRYVLAQDDSGARYWSYAGTVPVAERSEA